MVTLPIPQAVSATPATWRSFSGAVVAHPQSIAYPQSIEALQSLLSEANQRRGTVRPVGAGQSCAPIMSSSDIMVSVRDINIPAIEIHMDDEHPLVTLAAGAAIGAVTSELADQGIALPQLFSPTNTATIAGIVQTGSRGSQSKDMPFHRYVQAVELVDGRGFRHWITDPEELQAVRCGLGTIGVLTRVAIRATRLRNMAVTRVSVNAEQILEDFDMHIRDHDHAWIDWQPMSNRSELTIMDATDVPPTITSSAAVRSTLRSIVPTVAGFLPVGGKLAALGNVALWSTEQEIVATEFAVAPHHLAGAHHLGATLPYDQCAPAIYGAFEIMERMAIPSPLPVRIESTLQDTTAWLSPGQGPDGVSITFSALPLSRPGKFFKALSVLMRDLGGRPHWHGVHSLRAGEVADLYPRLQDFHAVRRQYDPNQVFISPEMAQRLGVQ